MASTKKTFVSENFSVDVSALHDQNTQHFVQSAKLQATSRKRQASSSKQQAQSSKRQAASHKQQAAE
jgi:hypothetical protein